MDLLAAATEVLAMARAHDVRLATAESCTGGLIFATLTEIAGSSDVMDRGFVTYSNAAKRQMLGVPATLIAAHGAVSREVAAAMATGALARSDAQVAIAVTGVAGPGGTPLKPEGMVCFGLARKGRACRSEIVEFGAIGRAQVRHQTTAHALALLLQDIPHPA